VYGAPGRGELAETLLVMPYYDSDGTCTFFDDGGPADPLTEVEELVTPSQFWSNSQDATYYSDRSFNTPDGTETFIAPRVLRGAANVAALDTAHWKSGDSHSLEIENAPEGSSVPRGCVMLEGDVATGDSDSSNNTQGVSPLQPGTKLNFGYDFHFPFGAGNETQGDELGIRLGFTFLQTRHTEAPDFGSYSPGSNTPN
jgi:hypothetical protein